MLVAHDIAHEVEDILHALVFLVGEAVVGGMRRKRLVDQHALGLEVGRHIAQLRRVADRHHQERSPRENRTLPLAVGVDKPAAAPLHQQQLGEERALGHHVDERRALPGCDSQVGGIGTKYIAEMILGGKILQVVYLLVHAIRVFMVRGACCMAAQQCRNGERTCAPDIWDKSNNKIAETGGFGAYFYVIPLNSYSRSHGGCRRGHLGDPRDHPDDRRDDLGGSTDNHKDGKSEHEANKNHHKT